MSDFKNQREIYEHLLQGGTVKSSDNQYFKFNEKGFIINTSDIQYACPSFDNPASFSKSSVLEYQYVYSFDSHKWFLTENHYTEDEISSHLEQLFPHKSKIYYKLVESQKRR